MKKILFTAVALFALTSVAFAQTTSKAADRKATRLAHEVKALDEMKAELGTRTFVFYPTSYTLPFQNPVELYNYGYYYLDFYAESMDIYLPFAVNGGPAIQFNSAFLPYSNYKLVHTDGNNYVVTATLTNVSNSMAMSGINMQDMNLGIHLSLNIMSGWATLTLTPDFSPAVTYQGVVRSNN